MASIHEKPNSPFWFAHFTLPDGKRTGRSTGVPIGGGHRLNFVRLAETLGELLKAKVTITPKPDAPTGSLDARDARRLAKRIADQFEDSARAASDGRFVESRARKAISDIYSLGSANKLPSSSTEDFLDAWLQRKELEAGQTTHTKYASVIAHLKQSLGSKVRRDITAITAADITKFRDDMAKRLAVGSVNVALKIVRSALGQARRDGLVDVNEAERVTTLKRKADRFERRPFTLEELKRIIEAADNEWKGMILFGLYSGQRIGDVAALTWQNIDLQREELRLTTEKTSRRQIIPMAPPLVKYVEGLPSSDNPAAPLFPKAHATVERLGRAAQLSNEFYDLLAGVGLAKRKTHHADENKRKGRSSKRELNPLSFHSLRHTATSLLKNAGVSDAVAMEFIGHDSKTVSQQYTHIDGATLRAALSKLPDVTR